MSEHQKYERSKHLWTTDKDKWFLVLDDAGRYGIWSVQEDVTGYVLLEKEDEHKYVVSKMIENNVRVISRKEFIAMLPSRNVPLWRYIMVRIDYGIGLFVMKIIETIYKIKSKR